MITTARECVMTFLRIVIPLYPFCVSMITFGKLFPAFS